MRAVFFESFGQRPRVADLPSPTAPSGGVVIDVEATGLCRSDWHAWAGHDDSVALPHVPGHELVGRIAQVGAGVREWRRGQRVTTPFVCGCGRCEQCRSGNAQVCPNQTQPGFTHFGSWAEQVVIHAADHNLVAVPEDLPAEAVVGLGCRFATAFRGLHHRARLQRGETAAVVGCGGVGLSAIMIARALGARTVAVDVADGALDLARRFGADDTVNAAGLAPQEVADAIVAAAGRRPAVTVEALGREETMNAALLAAAPLGRHVQIGLFAHPPVTAMPRVIGQEIAVFGSHGMPAADYPELVDLVASGALRPADLVTRTIGLDEVPEALVELGERTRPGMTLIRP
ncbi:alcohol dehydrogenase catalytic domain-containing protein [Brevibacterium sp. BRM-1]|uniref:alcohol dehydrogenase catalytic domain-containing protein n=1 Tax=Brevibacterium sp. BRM-1 TaxID=2999062 RepID=UPI00227EF0BC|nr:alcohol dehydrogenase catalytic domain-containing protein [Brevibacterium sp. BRM-1]WAL41370.1 alcohol dehydrogenase catalytic domain-containing protein [Brevibacterium sp. BRM-1]